MNDATIRDFLRKKLDDLARSVQAYYQDIRGLEQTIEDKHKKIQLLKVHYTSLLNSMRAYGYTEEQMKEDGYATLDSD